ncbi:MAG: redoxin domain-containing protein [Thaumarchaeota archaeon]|nr:redoxin domain-containing protein [Nitrososphaerota archaeon]
MFDRFHTEVLKAPDFPSEFQWINSDRPLSLGMLSGHVVVLDFWTYCCINCMHTLPVLAQLEKKFEGKPVIFIGIHSAKFSNEQDGKNIEQAVRRYEISHPVLVDEKMTVWRRYGITGWPTIVIIDPRGNLVYRRSGEGQKEMIEDTIEVLLETHSRTGMLARNPVKAGRRVPEGKNTLSFPGKLAISNDKIAISDSNHNRIIITDMSGKIMHTVGGKRRGFVDGNFEDALFFRPQGVAWRNDELFVADTENHSVRMIDVTTGQVVTLAGTGRQGGWLSPGGRAVEVALSSPWDVAVRDDLVFIAMAGNHQIWTLDTRKGLALPFAGNGQENLVDGNRMDAQLAQPSGLSIFGEKLYFTDSETSSIREIDLQTNHVRTVVGSDLFIFGHKDGLLEDAKFQHPLGLCALGDRIFVADTYNSSLREINLQKNSVSTIIGRGYNQGVCSVDSTGCDCLGLYEPSDVKFYKSRLYIADTNNHLIRVYHPGSNVLSTLEITP